ncbi:MAG: hypothetical protein WCP95_07325 [Actinomycetes bacterium]
MRRRLLGSVSAFAVLVLATGCGGGGDDAATGLADDATVTYTFRDASVPPPFHRSVTLTVARDTSRIVIDSYGDVLADTSVATPPDVWAELGTSIDEISHLTPSPPGEGCTGGTGRSVTVVSGTQTLADVDVEFCANSNAGLDSAMDAWIKPARDLFPSTEELAPPDKG